MLKYVIMTDSGFCTIILIASDFFPLCLIFIFFLAFIYIHVIFKKTESKKKKRKTLKKREKKSTTTTTTTAVHTKLESQI